MMPEIALNILDIAENSVRAGASLIEITVSVQPEEDKLTVVIKDDGCGMTPEEGAGSLLYNKDNEESGTRGAFFQAGCREYRRQFQDRFGKRKRDCCHGSIYSVTY